MKITLNVHPSTGNGTCIVEREPGDRRFRRGGFGGSAESNLLYQVRNALNEQGYDFIKKRMWRDGHLVDDHQLYLRERHIRKGKRCITVRNSGFAVYDAGERFNTDGRVELLVENIGMSMDPVVRKAAMTAVPAAPATRARTMPSIKFGFLGKGGKVTDKVTINPNDLPATIDDPLGYSYGFQRGLRGDAMLDPGESPNDVSEGYVKGYEVGARVHAGTDPMPDWVMVG